MIEIHSYSANKVPSTYSKTSVSHSVSSNTYVMKETHQNILIHKLMQIIMNDHRYIGCVDINSTYGL